MGYITTQYSTKKAVSRKAHCCCCCCWNACMRSTIEVIHLHELLLHIQPWRFIFTGTDLIHFAKLVHFLCSTLESQKAMVEFLKLLFLTFQNVHIQDTSVQSHPRIPCGTDCVFFSGMKKWHPWWDIFVNCRLRQTSRFPLLPFFVLSYANPVLPPALY